MENLVIPGEKSTPEINFNAQSHLLSIIGESYPENTVKFYVPVIKWLEEYLASLQSGNLTVNIELIYFNSSSSQVLLNIFELFETSAKAGNQININWIYDEENDSALESGEDFDEELSTVNFKLIEKS